jgi:alginate O-acetyltransferase complex protein AlgI
MFYILKHKYRWSLLLLASCYFYMFFKPVYILILFGTIIIDYYAAILIDLSSGRRRKWFLTLSIFANVGVLAVFKYYNFLVESLNVTIEGFGSSVTIPYLGILLPIGLSFHTFQAMSYTIEVYRGNFKPERHFGIYSLYVMFYPQLVAGPIERPQHILPQMHKEHKLVYSNVSDGLKLMLWGLFKKIVIADRLAQYTNQVYDNYSEYQGIPLCLGAAFFSLQIFFDFSAYSDIAIGCARTMGYDLMQNFNRPYSATSIGEYWSRWHISLSSWFKDYLYIPLGGNKVSLNRWMLNIFIVFTLSGLWHGASWTYIAWGALHGIYLITEKLLNRFFKLSREKFILPRRALVFFFVTLAFVFFRSVNFSQAGYILKNMFDGIPEQVKGIVENNNMERMRLLYCGIDKKELFLSLFLLIFVEFVHSRQRNRTIPELINSQGFVVRWGMYFLIFYGLLFLGVFEKVQFIYFQF